MERPMVGALRAEALGVEQDRDINRPTAYFVEQEERLARRLVFSLDAHREGIVSDHRSVDHEPAVKQILMVVTDTRWSATVVELSDAKASVGVNRNSAATTSRDFFICLFTTINLQTSRRATYSKRIMV